MHFKMIRNLLTAILLALGLVVSLAACSPSKTEEAPVEPDEVVIEEVKEEPEPEPVDVGPAFEAQTFTGEGDYIKPFLTEVPAIVEFSCSGCTGNTILKTNGRESLLVNTIGDYSGSHVINVFDGSMTTEFNIRASGPWTLTIRDSIEATRFPDAASGVGDMAFFMDAAFESAVIQNDGESNFIVRGYLGGVAPLNTIGAYNGTVAIHGPNLVQVTSTGNWSITPQ